MDLLSSILNSMDKPPSIGNQEKLKLKKQKEQQEKQLAAEKERMKKFREKIEDEINRFIQKPDTHKHKFEPMEKTYRSIVHDVAEIAGLAGFSFGEEEIDRYVMVFKKEYAPSDVELLAYRKGEEWDPEKAKETAKIKELVRQEEAIASQKASESIINPLHKEKHDKRLGREAAKDATKIVAPNRQFGFVPSENKKDQRSIEQTLADIRSKKKLKMSQESDVSSSRGAGCDDDES